jgi:subtilisin-like proprotein convertase family protein
MKKIALILVSTGFLLACSLGWAQPTEVYSFSNLNRTIPDGNLSGLSDTRSITSSIPFMAQVRVKLHIAGQFNGDLYAYLRQVTPTRTNFCVLLNRPGRATTNLVGYADPGFDVTFEHGAANGDIHRYRNVVTPAVGQPVTGIWQPDGRNIDPLLVLDTNARTTTLGSFAGSTPSGEWTLYVVDTENGGTNSLRRWELEFNAPIAPTITWTNPADLVYGTALGATQLNATSSVPGSFTYNPPAGTFLNAGAGQLLTAIFSPTDTNSFLSVTTSVPLNVSRAALTVTANNTNKVYGSALPVFTAKYNGFVNGDTPASLDTPVNLTTAASSASPVGNYAILASGTADANYNITHVNGSLSVTKALLTITANNTNKVYGAALPVLTANYTGFVNGDTPASLDTPVNLTTPATLASPVGTYSILASGAIDANYTVTHVNGTLSVTRAPLTITANNTNKVYGAASPVFTATYSGFVNGDTPASLSTALSLSSTATPGSPVGNYSIVAAGASGANYTVTHVNGTLAVTRAPLTITANNTNKLYGAPLPNFTATYSGFVNGDTFSSLDVPVTFSTLASASSPVGGYAIVASGAAGSNYLMTYVNGLLTILRTTSVGALTSSANPGLPGTPVTFAYAVNIVPSSSVFADGSVRFVIDGAAVGDVVLSNGVASYVTSSLSVGLHTVTAEYPGTTSLSGCTNNLVPAQLINTPPIAATDTIDRWATNGTKVAVLALLSNDTDADGDLVTFLSVAATSANGAALSQSNGWIFYQPSPGFTNVDSFTYLISDGRGMPVTGTVNVGIRADNGPSSNVSIVSLGDGTYLVRVSGIPGKTYGIEFAETLNAPDWQPLASGVANAVGMFEFVDAPPSGTDQRFYRAIAQ